MRFGKRPIARKPSLREQQAINQAAHKYYAALTGKTPMFEDMEPDPVTQRRKSADPEKRPLEKEVQKAVLKLLRSHPAVHWVARINSGTFVEGDRFIQSNSQKGMSDILGMLKGGRMIAVEVKRPGEKANPHQKEFLDLINAGGGLAFVATSVDDVLLKIGAGRQTQLH